MAGRHRAEDQRPETKRGPAPVPPKELSKRTPGKALKDLKSQNPDPKGPAADKAAKKAASAGRDWSILRPKKKN